MARILVVGPGRVGTALAIALKQANHTIIGAIGRTVTSESSRRFHELIGEAVISEQDSAALNEMVIEADIVLLCVRDRDIAPLAIRFANQIPFRDNQLVCHTSGAAGLSLLQPLRMTGAMVGCMHPLQTFADPLLAASKLTDTYFAVTGTARAASILEALVKDMGGKPFFLPDEDRARYHAGAVLASNALVSLAYTATSLMPDGSGLKALMPLLEGTITNLKEVGLPDALTGPIDRGDIDTVLTHLRALEQEKDARSVYQSLGKVTVTVASKKGSLDEKTKSKLLHVLQDSGEEE